MKYPAIDLVITKQSNGIYEAYGGPAEAIFTGTGKSADEAVGSWFRQNREKINFAFTLLAEGEMLSSTQYGKSRSVQTFGSNELKVIEQLKQSNGN